MRRWQLNRTGFERLAAALVVLATIVVGAVVVVRLQVPDRTPAERAAVAAELFDAIDVTVALDESTLLASQAIADFGLEEGIRMVPVRIVDGLALEVRITAARDVTLAEAPRLCLVGPFWNPLDAGLSDRCWGDPDLTALLDEREGAADGLTLRAGSPVVLEAALARGETRCDYPPGDWLLEVDAIPVVDGQRLERMDIGEIPLTVPLEGGGALQWKHNSETRFCSFTAAVYTRQGEPEITGR